MEKKYIKPMAVAQLMQSHSRHIHASSCVRPPACVTQIHLPSVIPIERDLRSEESPALKQP